MHHRVESKCCHLCYTFVFLTFVKIKEYTHTKKFFMIMYVLLGPLQKCGIMVHVGLDGEGGDCGNCYIEWVASYIS